MHSIATEGPCVPHTALALKFVLFLAINDTQPALKGSLVSPGGGREVCFPLQLSGGALLLWPPGLSSCFS